MDRNPMWAELDDATYLRLCECRNTHKDVPKLARSVYHYRKSKDPSYEPIDALTYTFEHLDMNSQFYLTDVTEDRYQQLLTQIR